MTDLILPGHPRFFDEKKAAGRQYEKPTQEQLQNGRARRSIEDIQAARAIAKACGCDLSDVLGVFL